MKKSALWKGLLIAVIVGACIGCVKIWNKKAVMDEKEMENVMGPAAEGVTEGIRTAAREARIHDLPQPDIVWIDCGEDRKIILRDEKVKSCVYRELKKEEDSPLYESELDGWEGRMDVGWYYREGPTIHNGEELDFFVTYFKEGEGALSDSALVVGEDLGEWTREQLQELRYIEGEVQINGKGENIPAGILEYLVGAENLIFDGTCGVSGAFTEGGGIPENIRKVTLYHYTPDKYESLLDGMQRTRVELIVTQEVDLLPVLEKKMDSLRISFCQEVVEFEDEELYPDGGKVICPELDDVLGWKEKDEDEENFLAIYQRCIDEERVVECFSIRREYDQADSRRNMEDVRIFFRVNNGGEIKEFIPQCEDEMGGYFGDFRRDNCIMKDINFDGVRDITLNAGFFGAQALSHEFGWIWEEEKQEYVACNSYWDICNPFVDPENEIVRGSWRNWAASHSYEINRYEEGEFVPVSVLTVSEVTSDELLEEMELPEDAEVWEYREEVWHDGAWEEIQRFNVANVWGEEEELPEAYYRFYEADSYFGGR